MIEDVNNFGILTTDQEKQQRFNLCQACEKKTMILDVPTCDACACPIDYVIKYKFKICPIDKWGV